jgi:aconitate hydratase
MARPSHVDDIKAFSDWATKGGKNPREIAYRPARVLMQDFTGVPAVVDLAAMRDGIKALGGDPQKINPLNPVDLVIDHSVMIDEFGNPRAFQMNVDREYERNMERYTFLKWGQKAFNNFRVVPPGTGICHQVNLEYLAQTVWTDTDQAGETVAYPDTLVGTDSHTTMVNGAAVLGWGVGGIEAEAAMLGQPISMLIPEVVGFKLTGAMVEGTTGTDLVLKVVRCCARRAWWASSWSSTARGSTPAAGGPRDHRQHGAGIRRDLRLLPDRRRDAALPAQHRPRRGAHRAGRGLCQGKRLLARGGLRAGLHRHAELDMGTIVPAISGPKRPQDYVALTDAKAAFADARSCARRADASARWEGEAAVAGHSRRRRPQARLWNRGNQVRRLDRDRLDHLLHQHLEPLRDDRRGLVARKARELGLNRKPWVKTSLAPGSQVVTPISRPRACRRISTPSASTSWAMAAPPASATPARCRRRSPRRSTTTT